VERPRQQLAGFQRVTVQPNETKTVEIALPASRLAYWDAKLQDLRVEAGPVSLMIGDSSANMALSTTVQVK
jgi:beta-glucosidase